MILKTVVFFKVIYLENPNIYFSRLLFSDY